MPQRGLPLADNDVPDSMVKEADEMAQVLVDTAASAELMDNALESCARMLGMGSGVDVAQAARAGHSVALERLVYGLAREAARYLGAADATIKAVYVYDPEYSSGPEDAMSSSSLGLIVWASRRSAALISLVNDLVATLAEERRRVLGASANALCCALDVQVVDDAQVQRRTGYGALIHSLNVRPLEVWRR
jgi:hypothetical protein